MSRRVILLLTALVVIVAVAAAIATYFAIRNRGLVPETAALVIASVTLVGALVTQVVNAHIARSNQKLSRELEDQRARAEALRNYLERLGKLVSKEKLRTLKDPYDDRRILARVQTKTVLRGLSPARNRDVLVFLREMRLINRDDVKLNGTTIHPRIVGLSGADLSKADLRNMRLISTSREEPVSLEGAILEEADLTSADLEGADLSSAVLRGASLKGTNLTRTSLREADLFGADLSEADLSGANLQSVRGVTTERLEKECKSLAGATMPDGSEHD